MVYSDTTNKTGLIQRCEFLTNLGDTAISGNATLLKQFTASINTYWNKILTVILKTNDEWDYDDLNKTDFPILTTSTVASQEDYAMPAGALKIKRLEISYDGTNWYKAEPFDVTESGVATDTTSISANFSTSQPFYDMLGNSILLYPIPSSAVTNGLKIWIAREPTYFVSTDTTKEPGFDEPFHDMVAVGASMDFAVAKGLKNKSDLASMYADYESKLKGYYGSKQSDREYILQSTNINYE